MSKLIALEGIDGSGKSSQIKILRSFLERRGHLVTTIAFPDRTTTTGKLIDAILKGEAPPRAEVLAMIFTANRWELQEKIYTALNRGHFVLLDRYIHSGIAYGIANGLDDAFMKSMQKRLALPNVVIYMDITSSLVKTRSGFGEERYETTEFLDKVTSAYRKIHDSTWEFIDASNPIDVVSKDIACVVSNIYKL